MRHRAIPYGVVAWNPQIIIMLHKISGALAKDDIYGFFINEKDSRKNGVAPENIAI
jgi:hypothetical protein